MTRLQSGDAILLCLDLGLLVVELRDNLELVHGRGDRPPQRNDRVQGVPELDRSHPLLRVGHQQLLDQALGVLRNPSVLRDVVVGILDF